MSKKAYIFRGSPASGKGTLTEMLIKELKDKTTLLELDTFRWGFHHTNRKVEDITDEEHAFAYHNLLLLLESYCKNGQYNLVIEGLFSWDKKCPHGNVQDIVRILKKYDFDYKIFLLSTSFDELWNRNLKRAYSVPEDEFRLLYDFVMQEVRAEEIIIETKNKTPEDSIDEIIKFL